MLLTDNEILIEKAKMNYNTFKVPTNFVESKKTQRYYNWEHKADLDIKTSVNKIGEIVNLSQQLNSLLWEKVNNGTQIEQCHNLYLDICKLAVLSNIEIDKAKKEFVINSGEEIEILKSKYKLTEDYKTVKPHFFKMITTENGYKLSDRIKYRYFKTPMDFLQRIIARHNFRVGRPKKKEFLPFMKIVKKPGEIDDQGYYYKKKALIIQIIRDAKEEIRKLYTDYDVKTKEEKALINIEAHEKRAQCVEKVEKATDSLSLMYLLMKDLDNPECKDVYKFMFDAFFAKPNESFFKLINDSKEKVLCLVEKDGGDIKLYDFTFTKETQNIA